MKTKILAAAFLTAMGLAVGGLHAMDKNNRRTVEAVQAGQLVLTCEFGNGTRQVAPERVTGFDDGRWLFDNGSARSCELTEVAQ